MDLITFSHQIIIGTFITPPAPPSLFSLQGAASDARGRSRSILLYGGPMSRESEQWSKEETAFPQPEISSPLSQPRSNTLMGCADFNSKAGGGHREATGVSLTLDFSPYHFLVPPVTSSKSKRINEMLSYVPFPFK